MSVMADEPLPKRPRLDDGIVGGVRYFAQPVSLKPNGDLWPGRELLLLSDGAVVVDGKGPHGDWEFKLIDGKQCLLVRWHWNAQEKDAKRHIYTRIPHTESWLQLRCAPEWQCVLAPVLLPQVGGEVKMDQT